MIYISFILFTGLVIFFSDNIPNVSRKKSQQMVFPLLEELDSSTKTLITDRHLLPLFRTATPYSNVNLDFKVALIYPRPIISNIFMPARERFFEGRKKKRICNIFPQPLTRLLEGNVSNLVRQQRRASKEEMVLTAGYCTMQ